MHSSPSTTVRSEFLSVIRNSVKSSFGIALSDEELRFTISKPKSEMGDICTSISFKLAKDFKKSPKEIAERIAKEAKPTKLILLITELNGYVNATFDRIAYSKLVLDAISNEKDNYGRSELGKGEKVIVEFPSVNPNKPWHVGHVRNAILGNTISNILDFTSYTVEREDYIDDLGLQMAESLWGLNNLDAKPDRKYDQWLGVQYVEVNKRMEDPEVKKKIGEMSKKLEDLDSNESKQVRAMAEKCVLAQLETAMSYGIYHDVMIWESDIVRAKLLEKALVLAEQKGILDKPEEGKYAKSTVVKLSKIAKYEKELIGNEEEAKVIVRSNGAATYIAKDFAFHAWKFGLIKSEFKYQKLADQSNGAPLLMTSAQGKPMEFGSVKKAVNIIGSAQKYEQQVMRAMFNLLGHDEIASGIIHLAYGEVKIQGANLSTRSGTWMGSDKNYTADDLLKEAKETAYKIVSQSERITDKNSVDSISNSIALAAIKFEFLKFAVESQIVFSWEKALNFEGDSGPYCLYTYARATRVLEKGEYDNKIPSTDGISRAEDFELIKHIGAFAEIVEKTSIECRPNLITDYIIELSSLFSKFYEKMPIITGGENKQIRLAITHCARQTMSNALNLLGIETIEKM